MVFVPVSVTAMSGIPASHAGVASGFLMTGHEIGAALGVAVLSAVASTAGSLTTTAGAADAFSRGFVGAAVMGGVVAVYALLRMPATKATGGGQCTCTDSTTGGARSHRRPGASGTRATPRGKGGEIVVGQRTSRATRPLPPAAQHEPSRVQSRVW